MTRKIISSISHSLDIASTYAEDTVNTFRTCKPDPVLCEMEPYD